MPHPFRRDPYAPAYCECGLPASNQQHADPIAVEAAVRALASTDVQQALDTDPSTSHTAAGHAQRVVSGARRLVLTRIGAAGDLGTTDNELIAASPEYNPNTIRPRRIELLRDGLIAHRLNGNNQPVQRDGSHVWVISHLGRVALQRAA